MLDKDFYSFLSNSKNSWKIAFFQDEYYRCEERFKFINDFGINCIYTLLEPQYFKDFYLKYTKVDTIVYNIPSYVSDDLIKLGKQITKSELEKKIDIGYRGRKIPWFYTGKGAQEKTEIAIYFSDYSQTLDLKIDISTEENKRIYGNAWYEFLAECRAVLGVEAGVSIMDIHGLVRKECEKLIEVNPQMTFEEVHDKLLYQWENNIPYRTIGPRHFEAAALKTCQILFEGNYSGILLPMVHYIPLKKDFSNFDSVISMFRNPEIRSQLVDNAYNDLIISGKYTYKQFVVEFDNKLIDYGLKPYISPGKIIQVNKLINGGNLFFKLTIKLKNLKKVNSPLRIYRNLRIRYYPAPIKDILYSKFIFVFKFVDNVIRIIVGEKK
jgi:hypothetical protein